MQNFCQWQRINKGILDKEEIEMVKDVRKNTCQGF
jgi:hypothetical protein